VAKGYLTGRVDRPQVAEVRLPGSGGRAARR